MTALERSARVGVVGAGTMGAGIAQVAAAAGHGVLVYDAIDGAAAKGKQRLAGDLDSLVRRGKLDGADAKALLDRIVVVNDPKALAGAALIVEAIIEDLDAKRSLFGALESIVTPEAILATNTSSISITSIARGMQCPGRIVGMHFFNPAPIMKLVEVVSGVLTASEVARSVFATAKAWGKVAVHAKSTPGFIVNRVARAYYGEPLRLYEENVASAATLDALMTEGAGFRMGPFELMDLIGVDVNYAVSHSVFSAYHQEPRFRPSLLQLEMVNAGLLGRKSGKGFFEYAPGASKPEPSSVEVDEGIHPVVGFDLGVTTTIDGVSIRLTEGQTAHEVSKREGRPVILHDLQAAPGLCLRLGFAASGDVPSAALQRFVASLKAKGIKATQLPDWPGLVAMRTVAMIANEGFEASLQGVATEAAIDDAMRYGVNYPMGPMGWAREIGLARVLAVLDHLYTATGDPRYRASLALRLAVQS